VFGWPCLQDQAPGTANYKVWGIACETQASWKWKGSAGIKEEEEFIWWSYGLRVD